VDLGIFRNEITKVPYKQRKEVLNLENDEGIRENVTVEKLGELQPIFAKNGTVTAGNAYGISDGASALIIASQAAVEKYKIEPLAEIVDWEVSGVDPSFMGLGPVPAIRKLLERQKMTLRDISHVELNEAFASQVLGVCRELGIENDLDVESGKVNPHGGAIAMGHPLGASGARLLTTIAHSLSVGDKTFGLASACIGGGQGYAVLLKKVGA
jgi:acetyl-CoA acetyltransferase family protein